MAEDWLTRVKDERAELRVKHSNLALFFGTEVYQKLPQQAKGLLRLQYSVMESYLTILGIRIADAEATAG